MRIGSLQYGAADKACCLEYHMVGAGAKTVLGGVEVEWVEQPMGRVRAWQHDCDCAAARPQAAVVNINILCSFLQLSSGLNLSACTCWGGIHPHSLRHTPRVSHEWPI